MAEKRGEAALILAVASGQTVREAARHVGLAERTAYRRAAEPEFRLAVSRARADLLTRAVGQLADTATAAVATLRSLLDSERVQNLEEQREALDVLAPLPKWGA
jgi:hypothetical protein